MGRKRKSHEQKTFDAFVRTINKKPNDLTTRAVFADFLEDTAAEHERMRIQAAGLRWQVANGKYPYRESDAYGFTWWDDYFPEHSIIPKDCFYMTFENNMTATRADFVLAWALWEKGHIVVAGLDAKVDVARLREEDKLREALSIRK